MNMPALAPARCTLLLFLLLAWPGLAAAQEEEIEPIKLEASHQHFYNYLLPSMQRPALDPEPLPKKVRSALETWHKASEGDGGDVTQARRSLLEALDKGSARLTADAWLLMGDLRFAEAKARHEEAMLSYDPESDVVPEIDLEITLAAYREAAEIGGAVESTWAQYAIALATSGTLEDLTVEALEAVASSDAVATLSADAWIRLGEEYDDPARSEDALRKALGLAEGRRKGRACVELATRAFLADDREEALGLAVQALQGDTFDGDDERAMRLVVECLAIAEDLRGESLPGSADVALRASILTALGDYWMRGNVGQHPVEAKTAWREALDLGPGTKAASRCQSGINEADDLIESLAETEEQWVERISRLCFDRAMSVDPSLNCAADLHLTPVGDGSATLDAEVRQASGRGKAALESCLEGTLPAPINARFTEKDLMVLFDNY